ncbi:MAG TPA: 4-hydroxy-tetrahydrodipicolinate reductase, partial [Feifaniaceae bacterium]|nr:4-hydroxy-tetrahydrodipicolinate reductase [Feifaniaceae bacterium]
MIKVIVNGACGQMGRTIMRLCRQNSSDFQVLAGVATYQCPEAEGVPIVNDIMKAPPGADVVIDFSRPAALPKLIQYCQANKIRLVIGTTGYGENDKLSLERAATKIPIFLSGNMSLGVNLQIELIKKAAAALGDAFDIEITEKHHNLKVDAPSGTALMLADAVSTQFPSGKEYVFGRHTKDVRRSQKEIGLHSVRGGTIVGEHEVEFFGQDEVVSISHKAYSKQVFGMGALRAAQYLMHKQPGLYNMHDIVTEKDVLSHLYTDDDQAVITVSSLPNEPGVLSHIFGTIARSSVFVDMISVTVPGSVSGSVSFSLPKSQLATAINALKALRPLY